MRSKGLRGALPYLSAAVLASGFSAPLNKMGIRSGFQSIALNVYRMGFTVLLLAPFALSRRENRQAFARMSTRHRLLMLLSGAVLAAHFVCWVVSLTMTDAFAATTLCCMNAVFAAIGSYLFFHEKTRVWALAGMGLALLGTAICGVGSTGGQLMGNFIALLAGVMQAGYYLCGRALRKHMNTGVYTTGVYGTCAVILLAFALIMRQPLVPTQPIGFFYALLTAIICTLIGHTMQNLSLAHVKATTISVIMLGESIFGPIMVWLFFGEIPAVPSLIGGALILAGIIWYSLAEARLSPALAPARSA